MSQTQEAGQKILLIVADYSLRRLITLGLQYRGMRTIEASSPAALPADEIETEPPSLLVLDVDSGVSSDWELLEEVQEHHYLSTLPVVVLAWECLSLPKLPASSRARSPASPGPSIPVGCTLASNNCWPNEPKRPRRFLPKRSAASNRMP